MVKKVTTNSPAKLLHETNAGYLGSFDDPFNSGKDIILSTNIEHLEESNQTSSIKVNSGCDVQVESSNSKYDPETRNQALVKISFS
jgi:hypothetical protein